MSLEQYEPVRSSTTRFVVATREDHVDARTEHVVDRKPFYWVIEREPTAELLDSFSRAREGSSPRLTLVPAADMSRTRSADRLDAGRGGRTTAGRPWGGL
jgi:hypothetical protein